MAVRLTRAESAALTRSRLLEAAQRVFFERGFHGASLEVVAEEAGLTKGAVYSRFESKADLFLAYQEERNERTVERVRQLFRELGPGDRPSDVVIEFWRERLLHDPPEATLLVIEFWASACRDPEVHRRFSDQHERLMVASAEALEEAASRLGVTLPVPALGLIRLTSGIAHGLELEQLMNPDKIDPDMIELVFAPFREVPEPPQTSPGELTRGTSNDGKRCTSDRRRG